MTAADPARARSFRASLAAFATMLGGARDCAAAVEAGRRPSERALRAVGIVAHDWDGMRSR